MDDVAGFAALSGKKKVKSDRFIENDPGCLF